MGEHNSGPEEAVKGVVEGVKGKAKEVVGAVTGRDDIQREGQAQQDKADSQREAAKKEAEAEGARAAAKASEAREKAEQVPSQTVTLDQVTMMEEKNQGKRTGMVGVYFQGDTPASSNFITGRFAIDPGKTPHAPHTHIEEEVMIVERGTGETR